MVNRLSIVRVCAIVTTDIILINQYKKAVLSQRWPRECLRRSYQQGVGHFGPIFPGVTHGVDPWCLRLQRANIPGKLRWNYFRRIPTHVITIHQHYRQTTCDPKTALCTKVHRAVKMSYAWDCQEAKFVRQRWNTLSLKVMWCQPN